MSMNCVHQIIGLFVLLAVVCCITEAGPVEPWQIEKIMRESNAYEGADESAGTNLVDGSQAYPEIDEKRFSQSIYTSQRGKQRDKSAVRKLLGMFYGKRSGWGTQKRSGGDISEPSSSVFDDTHGYIVLVGRVTDDIMQQAIQDHNLAFDGAAAE